MPELKRKQAEGRRQARKSLLVDLMTRRWRHTGTSGPLERNEDFHFVLVFYITNMELECLIIFVEKKYFQLPEGKFC